MHSLICVSRCGTDVKKTEYPSIHALMPNAVAICVFPVPGLPYSTTFLPSLINSSVSSSGMIIRASSGKSSLTSSWRYFICGNPAILTLCFLRFSTLISISFSNMRAINVLHPQFSCVANVIKSSSSFCRTFILSSLA